MKTPAMLQPFFARENKIERAFKRNTISFILGLFILNGIAYGQPGAMVRELTPIRGVYKKFASFSPKPKSTHEDIDKVKFPFDQASADKVLSLKPVYLQNISVNDFKLPDPPANSSEQTRAELNYLLALQRNRTLEDVRTSMYLSEVAETPSDVGRSIGYWINPETLPVTDAFMEKVSRDGNF